MKENKGITLIALVVTIIVLLILAGIMLAILTDENSIIGRAVKASAINTYFSAEEKVKVAYTSIRTEIKREATEDANYIAGSRENTEKLGQMIDNELNSKNNGKQWIVNYDTQGKIEITYKNPKIVANFVSEGKPYRDGETSYLIILEEHDAKLSTDGNFIKDDENPTQYVIAYDANTGIGTMKNQEVLYNQETNLDSNRFEKKGYAFKCWNTIPDGTGVDYQDIQAINNLGDVVLYAQWEETTTSTFIEGQNVNSKMKSLLKKYGTSGSKILGVKKASTIEDKYKISENVVSINGDIPIYMWYDNDNGNIYYFSEANEIYLNENGSYLFNDLQNVKEIEIGFRTSETNNMKQMFYNCKALTSLDLSNLKTNKVKDMSSMFGNLTSLERLDLSSFYTNKVTTMENMFNGATGIRELNVSSFKLDSLKNMQRMFSSMKNLVILDISSFNTENVTNMTKMFDNMNELTTIYASEMFKTDKVSLSKSTNMFYMDKKLVGGNGTPYNESCYDKTYAVIDTPDTPGYFTYREYK